MSFSKQWIANLIVGLLAVCPIASAQTVFNDAETQGTQPKAEWRQKVLHNNKAPQQITRVANQETEYRVAQRSSNRTAGPVRPKENSPSVFDQPKNVRVAQREMPVEPQPEPQATQYEPMASEGAFAPQGNCAPDGDCGGDSCGNCGDCGEDCPWMNPFGRGPRNIGIFGGVHGYKGPRDRGVNGNFGFQEGVNLGAPLGDPWGCGFQVGFAALQSNISGYQQNIDPSVEYGQTTVTADRHQYFITAGIFRRAECAGWQWGVVFDFLNDTYVQESNLKQIRTETGYLFNECFEIGYSGAYGVGGDEIKNDTTFAALGRQIDGQLDATDQFVVYFRRYFDNGGDGRLWGGMTGHGDGLFGADVWIPLGGSWSLQNSFNYLIPKGGKGSTVEENANLHLEGAQVRESWSVALNLVWYPGRSSKCIGKSCYRPLLNVADNSLFMVRETTTTTIKRPQ